MLRVLDWVACKVGLGTLRSGSGAVRVGPETLRVDSIGACPVYLAQDCEEALLRDGPPPVTDVKGLYEPEEWGSGAFLPYTKSG